MPKLLRIALVLVVCLILADAVWLTLTRGSTGPVEKVVGVVLAGLLVLAAVKLISLVRAATTR
jgi:Mn2+/Fe2+ NRAMP family transporter